MPSEKAATMRCDECTKVAKHFHEKERGLNKQITELRKQIELRDIELKNYRELVDQLQAKIGGNDGLAAGP